MSSAGDKATEKKTEKTAEDLAESKEGSESNTKEYKESKRKETKTKDGDTEEHQKVKDQEQDKEREKEKGKERKALFESAVAKLTNAMLFTSSHSVFEPCLPRKLPSLSLFCLAFDFLRLCVSLFVLR